MSQLTGLARDQLLSILRTTKNRLEYLTSNDWTLILDKARQLTFKKNEALIQQGITTRIVYLLIQGKARVEADSKGRIAQIGPGDICGDMSFLEHGQPSASVIAEEEVSTYAIDWGSLDELFELFPHLASRFYRSLAVKLSQRLREQIVPHGDKG